jgi:polyphosphate kinase 2
MGKKSKASNGYKRALRELSIELVKLQRRVIEKGERILVILEGRDAAGKDGMIKVLTQHLSPRETRVFAPGKPSDRERTQWYFQRFVPQLPAAGEIVFFNRSWYNRAGVERVMGFCSDAECELFLRAVPRFEAMLAESGIQLFKYYLDISRAEQKRRLAERRADPLKQWKISPVDARAQKLWKSYSRARDAMFAKTHSRECPWTVVRADEKKPARLALLRDFLARQGLAKKRGKAARVDRQILFAPGAGTLSV